MATIEELRDYAKYPFTGEAKAFLESLKIDVGKVDEALLEYSLKRITDGLSKDFSPAFLLREINASREPFLMNLILSYPLAKILASVSEDRFLLGEYAKAEAKKVYHFLQSECDERKVLGVASQFFALENNGGNYTMLFQDYLRFPVEGREYALPNMEMGAGRVSLDRLKLCKLASEAVAASIIRSRVGAADVPKRFAQFAAELRTQKARAFEHVDLGKADFEMFPPCMKKIVADLRSGEPTGHMPRFVLSTFFANIDLPVDEAVAVFKNQPNFNEKKTQYYIEHSYGKGVGSKKYSVPACVKMGSYGLCARGPECRWKHPMSYYKAMKARRVK